MRQISECLPAWLTAEIERAVEGSACEALTLRSTAGKGGDGSLEGGETTVAFAHRGEEESRAQTEKKSEAVAPAVAVVGHRFLPTIGRSIGTASRTRRPTSAVLIDLEMVRAQRHAALRSMMD